MPGAHRTPHTARRFGRPGDESLASAGALAAPAEADPADAGTRALDGYDDVRSILFLKVRKPGATRLPSARGSLRPAYRKGSHGGHTVDGAHPSRRRRGEQRQGRCAGGRSPVGRRARCGDRRRDAVRVRAAPARAVPLAVGALGRGVGTARGRGGCGMDGDGQGAVGLRAARR
ncbi:protein of unknown function [Streptomyces murinus]